MLGGHSEPPPVDLWTLEIFPFTCQLIGLETPRRSVFGTGTTGHRAPGWWPSGDSRYSRPVSLVHGFRPSRLPRFSGRVIGAVGGAGVRPWCSRVGPGLKVTALVTCLAAGPGARHVTSLTVRALLCQTEASGQVRKHRPQTGIFRRCPGELGGGEGSGTGRRAGGA